TGVVEEIRQPLIEPSEYQKNLDEDEDSPDPPPEGDQSATVIQDRYWSDYNRVFYHPRTIQPVNWGFTEGPLSWEAGQAAFRALNEAGDHQTAVMHSSVVSRPTSTATTIQAYSSYVKEYTQRGELNQDCWKGLEKDDFIELVEDLTRLSDSISVEIDSKDAEDSAPDEEYEVDL
ncbi:hypothetical protein FRC00_011564, partial [Tulasnella sp. 408]